ncbi:5-hydroxytryptamine receptor 1D-like [Paramacrobiotus metropolitanus]|uniref:5-hydroxytryptamine receptor 1D-like n=1 Tax=Paramacrobiotus metropolitanus TaxID=2943436 RepID=UPI0024461C1C|nr:5-hydroxytryptamine receptor 1D-like [Paramacrobiotus metropolitanus]
MNEFDAPVNGSRGTNWSLKGAVGDTSGYGIALLAASQNIWVSIVTWFTVFSFCASLSLNLLITIVFLKHPHLRTAFNVYIFNLCATEVMIAVTAMPMNFVSNIYGYWPGGAFLCGLLQYSNLVIGAALRYGHVLISCNRLWAVGSPIIYRQRHTFRVATGVVLTVWMLLHFVQLPVVVTGRMTVRAADPRCILNTDSQYEMSLAAHILGFLFPEAFVVLTYPYILYKIHRRYLLKRNRISNFLLNGVGILAGGNRKISSGGSEHHSSQANETNTPVAGNRDMNARSPSNGRSASSQFGRSPDVSSPSYFPHFAARAPGNHDRVMLYLVVAIIICWTPNHVFFTMQRLYNYWNPIYFGVQYCIFYANSWINPIICYLTLHKIRIAINGLFKRKKAA